MKIRIGYDDADTLITYPYAHNLSACAQPIRVRGWIGPGRVHWLLRCNLSSPRPRPWSGFPTMSHAIPLRLLQTLNSRRWNCNVCGRFRLFGRPNCMRLLERVRLSCPERTRRTREPSSPTTECPGSADQRRLVVHHDQVRLARRRRRPHAGFQRRAALPAHPVAG